VIYPTEKKPDKPPGMYSGTVAYGNLLFHLRGVGYQRKPAT